MRLMLATMHTKYCLAEVQAFALLASFLSYSGQVQDDNSVKPVQSEGCGSVKVVKECEKTVKKCLSGCNTDDSIFNHYH